MSTEDASDDIPTCFYCFAPLLKGNREDDHMPIPKSCGGTFTVPACLTCHGLKDRMNLDSWSVEMLEEFMVEFSKLKSRTLRIFVAKAASLMTRAMR